MLSWSSGSGMGLLCYQGVVALVWDCYLTLNTDSYHTGWTCVVAALLPWRISSRLK